MKKLRHLLVFLLVVGATACKKELPPDTPLPEVLFKFSGIIDGNSLQFEAGEKNYIMYTDYNDQGASDVLVMRGEFRDKTNPESDYLRFDFYGYDSVNNGNVKQNVFSQTNYNSYSADSTTQVVGSTSLKFHTLYTTGATVNWSFGDGTFGTGDTVIHNYPASLNDATVTMNTFYPQFSCGDSVSNFINLADPINDQVQFDIEVLTQTIDSFSFKASNTFNSYSYNLDNQLPAVTTPNVSIRYFDSTKKHIVLTANKPGITSIWNAVLTPSAATPCFAAFRYDVLATPSTVLGQRLPYKTCIITYRTNGKTYSSFKNDASNQSNQVVFTLNNAQNYQQNERQQSTITLSGSVSTILYNTSNVNDSISIQSSQLKIAVAHP